MVRRFTAGRTLLYDLGPLPDDAHADGEDAARAAPDVLGLWLGEVLAHLRCGVGPPGPRPLALPIADQVGCPQDGALGRVVEVDLVDPLRIVPPHEAELAVLPVGHEAHHDGLSGVARLHQPEEDRFVVPETRPHPLEGLLRSRFVHYTLVGPRAPDEGATEPLQV